MSDSTGHGGRFFGKAGGGKKKSFCRDKTCLHPLRLREGRSAMIDDQKDNQGALSTPGLWPVS